MNNKQITLVLLALPSLGFSAAAFQKDAKAWVPSSSLYMAKETEKEILNSLDSSKLKEQKVTATFICNFTDEAKADEKTRVCTLQVVRPLPQ